MDTSHAHPLSIQPAELQRLLAADAGIVLLDVRDPGEAERGHLYGMTNLPRNRIEFRIESLVRDPATPIVVYCDGKSGRAELSGRTLLQLGYRNVSWLQGGLEAWRHAGGKLATGSNVPSKKFGEAVHRNEHVPFISPVQLDELCRGGKNVVVCDIRTPEEHAQACIPGAKGISGFDMALHARDLASTSDLLVVHCAGRTRGIIAAQTLVELGIQNVAALENGTIGWTLAGLELQYGADDVQGEPSTEGVAFAEQRARKLVDGAGVARMKCDALQRLLDQSAVNRYVFDVRGVQEYKRGHIAGSTALPGGQAVQRMDDFIALKHAPIVLIGAGEAQAGLAGVWLRRMGCTNVAILEGGIQAWHEEGRALERGSGRLQPAGFEQVCRNTESITVQDLSRLLDAQAVLLLDVDYSVNYRRGHISSAQWAPRASLESRMLALAQPSTKIVLTSNDGKQAVYACATLRSMGYENVAWLEGGTLAWKTAGLPTEAGGLGHQDDELLPPYRRGEEAMRDYLQWEILLAHASTQDGGDSALSDRTNKT
jgi:rhodanese-related sulfurtransferase